MPARAANRKSSIKLVAAAAIADPVAAAPEPAEALPADIQAVDEEPATVEPAPVEPVEAQPAEPAPEPRKTIQFRARSFVAFSLSPEAPLADWLEALDGWTANSPGFFAGRPVVLDLALLKPDRDGIAEVTAALAQRGIRTYAIEGVEDPGPDLPPLLVGAKVIALKEEPAPVTPTEDAPVDADAATAEAPPAEAPAAALPELPLPPVAAGSMIVRTPVRSGQSIYQPQGDVIVLGSVGSGSEIIAGGSVHVYGTLRGRVFAGASGDRGARIFCQKNEAELLAVDGWYRTAESMEPASRGRPIQAFLENGVVEIAALN